jgi:predicted DNA-binding transcriptional regulator AlpA
MNVNHDNLPQAVSGLYDKLEHIEKLLSELGNPPAQDPDEILNITQASALIRKTVSTIYTLVNKSEIPVSKKGNRLYFSKLELIAWIRSGRKKTNQEISIEAKHHRSI